VTIVSVVSFMIVVPFPLVDVPLPRPRTPRPRSDRPARNFSAASRVPRESPAGDEHPRASWSQDL